MESETYSKPLLYEDFIELISTEDMGPYFYKGMKPSITMILFTWIAKLVRKQNIKITKKVWDDIFSLVYNLIDTVLGESFGMSGKKQWEMLKFYNQMNDEILRKKGKDISSFSRETYQYILSCFDYMGISRDIKVDAKIIDVSKITYNDIENK